MKKYFLIFALVILNITHANLTLAENINITSSEAIKLHSNAPSDVIFLDIRTPQEHFSGHIDGSILLDFFAPDFEEKLKELDKNALIVMYCHIGKRSRKVFEMMKKLGFTNVHHMKDGILGWNGNDFPLVRNVRDENNSAK